MPACRCWRGGQLGLAKYARNAYSTCHHAPTGCGETRKLLIATLKAQDVKYSLERFAAKSGFRARFDDVERVEVVDDYTVKIITKHPFAPLLVNLAWPSQGLHHPHVSSSWLSDPLAVAL